ncbi:ATP-binding protein [Bacillus haynesii]|uniref:sensor histidine kinase n=1 Tax=Bacillus haynesii TaxID=1925021 RepID=UPI0022811BE6|nr:sensor histidine kinase [Bacillus haynesii]MCY8737554.1 ATP-binding protein [Bacillus haynesii]MEC0709745.1 ATP-binding protein [Bacillus haynesii]MEC0736876.1 ATP-binding protein [Bacillus haynesii]
MFILTALLWLMSTILFFTNPENEKTRWGSYIGFCGGFGGGSVLLSYNLDGSKGVQLLHYISSSLGHYGTAYAILIFGLIYSDTLKSKNKLLWQLLLFIPVIIMQVFFTEYPIFETHHVILAIWVVPYVVISEALMIYSAYSESNKMIRKQKYFTCLVIVPALTFALFTNIILEAFGYFGVWMLNPWAIAAAFLLFGYIIIKYGFLGVQIKFEKQRRNLTMQAVTSGTALLNHSIKNEVAKIDLLANQLKDLNQEKNNESIDLILKSTNHLFELSTRIQNKLDIMELKESEFRLGDLIKSSIDLLQPQISKVNLIKEYELDASVWADFVHLQETAINIMKNAMEAMGNSQILKIRIYKTRKKIHIDFIDNGKGIEKEKLSKILDPFFSTKKKVGNFGLGLTYCYNVMTKHKGDITIKSKLGHGTTITLSLPINRVLNMQSIQESKDDKLSGECYG